jgi:nucleotide-binding universal stress UspA family protein
MQFKNILFVNEPSSTSKSAALRAAHLAEKNSAKLTLCDASKELSRSLPQLKKTLEKIHKENMEAQFEPDVLVKLKAKTKQLSGTPFIEIIKQVLRGKHDLVIKTAEKSSSLFGGLFGETDLHLMRKCPSAVWIVKPSRKKSYAKIVAAVDPDPDVPSHAALNKDILDMAISLAQKDNAVLDIVHAWHIEGEELLRSNRAALTPKQVDEMVKDVEKKHHRYMDELLQSFDLSKIKHKVHLVKGVPGKAIPDYVKKADADVIVMGTLARTGIEGFFIGNTAEKILRNVDCSVLTLKPKGFKSPIGAS